MSAWINSSQVSVTTGATTVTVSDGVSMESVISGDALMIAGQLPARCLSGTAPAGGVSTITLAAPWDGPNITNAKAVVMPSAALLRQVATEVAQQNASYSSWWSVMEDWQYAMGTVTVDGPAGPREIPTYPQLAADTASAMATALKPGDFGLGSELLPPASNANVILPRGAYEYNQDGGAVGGPQPYGTLLHAGAPNNGRSYGGWAAEIFISNTGLLFSRVSMATAPGNGTFAGQPWHEHYTSQNVDGSLWHTPTLQNGWIDAGGIDSIRYTKRAGIVSIQGAITGGSTANGTILFFLPAGYCPLSGCEFACRAGPFGAGSAPVGLVVSPDGGVLINFAGASPIVFGITFAAGN